MASVTTALGARSGSQRSRRHWMERLSLIALQIIMTLVLITFLAPTLWMVSSSLKARTEIFANPIVWIPATPQWQNYSDALKMLPFGQFAINTFVLCLLTVAGTVLSSSCLLYTSPSPRD